MKRGRRQGRKGRARLLLGTGRTRREKQGSGGQSRTAPVELDHLDLPIVVFLLGERAGEEAPGASVPGRYARAGSFREPRTR
jgi:hypothetical protein